MLLQKTNNKGLDMIFLNELANPLGIEFLELYNSQFMKNSAILN